MSDTATAPAPAPDGYAAGTAPSILLGSGGYFDFLDPLRSNFTLDDLVFGLAYQARFAGQTFHRILKRPVFYSVAEHSVRMSHIVGERLARTALLHDAAEAFMGDMPLPLKICCPDFRQIETHCESAILARLDVPADEMAAIKHADLVMLATERRELTRWNGERWPVLDGIEPLAGTIYPLEPEQAAMEFRRRYFELQAQALVDGRDFLPLT